MTDPRYTKLAKLLIEYSTALKKGDRVLLDMIDVPDEFSIELMRAARAVGAMPLVEVRHTRVTREMLARDQRAARRARSRYRDVPHEKHAGLHRHSRQRQCQRKRRCAAATAWRSIRRLIRPVLNYRVNKTRWCVLRWPTPSMAQAAGMSTEAFENLYFDVCTMDYRKMAKAMVPLERRMKKGRPRPPQRPGHRPDVSASRASAPRCAKATATSPMAKFSPAR